MNEWLSRSVRRTAQTVGRVSIAAMLITVVACGGGGSSGGGVKRPPTVVNNNNDNTPPPVVPDPPPAVPGAPPATVLTLNVPAPKTFRFTWLGVGGATEYRLLEDPDGTGFVQVATMASDVLTLDRTVFLPSRINARYVLQSCNTTGCAPSATVSVTRDNFTQAIGYVKPSNTVADAAGGVPGIQPSNNALTFSADGKTLAFSVSEEDSLGTGVNGDQSIGADRSNNSGAVYILVNNAGTWSQQAYIKASDSKPGLYFGMAVSLSADGNTLAVGAPEESIDGNGPETADPRGTVYIFTRSDTTWSEQAHFRGNNTDPDDRFGFVVSLADDGNTLAVAAPTEDGNGLDPNDNSVMDSGAAYVFARNGTTWRQLAFLKASNPLALNVFGAALSLAGDGQTLAVGATDEDSAPGGDPAAFGVDNSGAAYVFVRNGDDTWTQQARLKASNAKVADSFGASLSLSRDGRTLAIGAPANNRNNGLLGPGSAYIFVRGDGNTWNQQNILAIASPDNDTFGIVSLTDDGNTLVVGAIGESSAAKGFGSNQADNAEPGSGAAYVFTRSGTNWIQQSYLKASNAQSSDNFGFAVAIAGDGQTLAVMAPGEDSAARGIGGTQNDESATAGGGAVYVY